MVLRRPSGFIEPCQPSKAARPPSGPLWVHEIKHDGYRLMVRRDGVRVRCFTRGGYDWADRFPAIVDAALRIKAAAFLIDGEAVIARENGTPDFGALRSHAGPVRPCCRLYLLEHDGRWPAPPGIVSKRVDNPIAADCRRRGSSRRTRPAEAVRREREEGGVR